MSTCPAQPTFEAYYFDLINLNFQVKTQQGVPSQPSSLVASEVGSTNIKLRWEQPDHSGENIISYELYWNDTYTPSVSALLLTFHLGSSNLLLNTN